MSGELREAIQGVKDRVEATDRVVANHGDRTNVIARLTGADYISLAALFVGWGSSLLFLSGEPNWALVTMFGALFLDKLDGWYARRAGVSSPFGRRVDSFIDIFAYLVPGALLYHVAIAPNDLFSLVGGFAMLAFGGLRLIRHSDEGFGSDGGISYYHGTTVVHTNLVVVANYFLVQLIGSWNGWVAGVLILLACPLMISDYKAYKTNMSHALAGLAAVVAVGLAFGLEWGYL